MYISTDLVPTVLGVSGLTLIASVVLAAFGVSRWWAVPVAIGRGIVQLTLLSLILTGIIADPRWIAVALTTMFLVAVAVATGRGGWSLRSAIVVLVAMAAG